jgi:hypothetical protein
LCTVTVLMVLLLWPAIYNGQPLFSPDTSAYIRGFDAGIAWLTGHTSAWTTWASPTEGPAAKSEQASFQGPSFIMAGRSISYGALLYFGQLLGGLWATIVIQSAAAVSAIGLTLRHLRIFSWPRFAAAGALLGLFSSLPFFASFLLPDIFAGLAILGAANLLTLGDQVRGLERVFWLSILALAVVFHPTHLAIVLILLPAAFVAWVWSKRISRFGVIGLIFVAGVGIVSELSFAVSVERLVGAPVVRPPVLMARIIADGTGFAYLRENCPQAGFAVCEFVGRMPVTNADSFLWDSSPSKGIYSLAPQETRRALSSEQYRFAAAVLIHDPKGEISAALNVAFRQLQMIGLSDFRAAADEALPRLPEGYGHAMANSAMGRKSFPLAAFSSVTIFSALFSCVLAAILLLRYWAVIPVEQKLFSLVVVSGELANAVVCGVLSGPHERYQARLSWLYPLLLLTLYFAPRCSTRTRRSQSASSHTGVQLPSRPLNFSPADRAERI